MNESLWRVAEKKREKADADARALEISTTMARRIPNLEEETVTDPLTGLLNRRGFLPFVENAIARLKRQGEGGRPVSIIFIDTDDFKSINDRHGHKIGDKVLKEVGRSLKEHVRGADKVSRHGGEEFVVLLEGASEEDAYKKAETLREMVGGLKIKLETQEEPLSFTVSLGVASMSWDDDFDDPETTLIDHANQAMHRAKEEGKNRTVLFSSD